MLYRLHPWVAFLVMPVFAFANAGVPLGDVSMADMIEPPTLGIAAGLFIGTLAFTDPERQNAVRLGVLSGSLASGLLGAAVLLRMTSAVRASPQPAG